ncbi:unnamed protein product, partial [Ixodes pacificus]
QQDGGRGSSRNSQAAEIAGPEVFSSERMIDTSNYASPSRKIEELKPVSPNGQPESECETTGRSTSASLYEYLYGELRRGYYLENDEQRYEDRREKFYIFFKIPRELEKVRLFLYWCFVGLFNSTFSKVHQAT